MARTLAALVLIAGLAGADALACGGGVNRGELRLQVQTLTRAIEGGTLAGARLAEALLRRGDAYLMLGEPTPALADLERAVALDGASAELYYHRGKAYEALGERKRALADYRRARALDPGHARAAERLHQLEERG